MADFLDHGMKGKSPGTVANYRSIADHHLIPFIGAANLQPAARRATPAKPQPEGVLD